MRRRGRRGCREGGVLLPRAKSFLYTRLHMHVVFTISGDAITLIIVICGAHYLQKAKKAKPCTESSHGEKQKNNNKQCDKNIPATQNT